MAEQRGWPYAYQCGWKKLLESQAQDRLHRNREKCPPIVAMDMAKAEAMCVVSLSHKQHVVNFIASGYGASQATLDRLREQVAAAWSAGAAKYNVFDWQPGMGKTVMIHDPISYREFGEAVCRALHECDRLGTRETSMICKLYDTPDLTGVKPEDRIPFLKTMQLFMREGKLRKFHVTNPHDRGALVDDDGPTADEVKQMIIEMVTDRNCPLTASDAKAMVQSYGVQRISDLCSADLEDFVQTVEDFCQGSQDPMVGQIDVHEFRSGSGVREMTHRIEVQGGLPIHESLQAAWRQLPKDVRTGQFRYIGRELRPGETLGQTDDLIVHAYRPTDCFLSRTYRLNTGALVRVVVMHDPNKPTTSQVRAEKRMSRYFPRNAFQLLRTAESNFGFEYISVSRTPPKTLAQAWKAFTESKPPSVGALLDKPMILESMAQPVFAHEVRIHDEIISGVRYRVADPVTRTPPAVAKAGQLRNWYILDLGTGKLMKDVREFYKSPTKPGAEIVVMKRDSMGNYMISHHINGVPIVAEECLTGPYQLVHFDDLEEAPEITGSCSMDVIPAEMEHPNSDVFPHLAFTCDGTHVRDVFAYNLPEGWVWQYMRTEDDRFQMEGSRRRMQRVRGEIEVRRA